MASIEWCELSLHFFRQTRADQPVRHSKAVTELVFRRTPRQVYPGAVKIGCLHTDTGINQYFSGLDAVSFHRNAWHDSPDAGKHLAADFPSIVPTSPWIRHFGAREGPAYRINEFTAHCR